MKLITETTVTFLKGKEKVTFAPGENDFPKEVGDDLVARGHARTPDSGEPASSAPAPGTVPWLKAELDSLGVEYTVDDKKPALEKLLKDHKEADKNPGDDTFTQEQIVEAISSLNEGDKSLWTDEGLPAVAAIEDVLGGDVTEDDRDGAWAAINA